MEPVPRGSEVKVPFMKLYMYLFMFVLRGSYHFVPTNFGSSICLAFRCMRSISKKHS